MKYRVNENCIGCGMCETICPIVFKVTDEGFAVAIDEAVADEYLASAAEAMDSCPVGAIEEAQEEIRIWKTKSFCYQCQETEKFKELSADEKENLKQVFLEKAKTIGVLATENEDIRSFLRM